MKNSELVDLFLNGVFLPSNLNFPKFLVNNPHLGIIHLLLHDVNLFRIHNSLHEVRTSVQMERYKKAFMVTHYVLCEENEIEEESPDIKDFDCNESVDIIDKAVVDVCRYFEKKSKSKFMVDTPNSIKPIVCKILINTYIQFSYL